MRSHAGAVHTARVRQGAARASRRLAAELRAPAPLGGHVPPRLSKCASSRSLQRNDAHKNHRCTLHQEVLSTQIQLLHPTISLCPSTHQKHQYPGSAQTLRPRRAPHCSTPPLVAAARPLVASFRLPCLLHVPARGPSLSLDSPLRSHLPACLPACLPAYLPACLPPCLPDCRCQRSRTEVSDMAAAFAFPALAAPAEGAAAAAPLSSDDAGTQLIAAAWQRFLELKLAHERAAAAANGSDATAASLDATAAGLDAAWHQVLPSQPCCMLCVLRMRTQPLQT